jgi:D-ribitol-5-phosphate cytidylyltransferase
MSKLNIGVIFAGGVGSRMHSKERPKQFLEIYNKPIIVHTIEYFQSCELIDSIVVVCVENWIEYFKSLVDKYRLDKIKRIVPGGKTGQLSIYNGLCAAKEISNNTDDDIVLIHDGVRPLINEKLLCKNIEDVKKYRTSITSGIVKETIVEIDDIGDIKFVPDRAHSRVAKAPQCFLLSDILSAHEKALSEGINTFIDSCTMMKYYGFALHMTDGPYENIKITTPDDFYTMRAILQAKEDAQIYGID